MVCIAKVRRGSCTREGNPELTRDATQRPYLHVYAHSNETEEVNVIHLDGVNIEVNPEMEALLGVGLPMSFCTSSADSHVQKKFTFTLFTSSNSYALAAPSLKELQAWTSKLDPTRLPS